MQISGKVIAVTGAASGIGKAMCQRFARGGAAAVIAADLDESGARQVAAAMQDLTRSVAVTLDVCNESQVALFIEQVIEKFGHIDLLCCNAGIFEQGGIELSNDLWRNMWDVNVMAHVYAARAVLPHMLKRGAGYLLNTASAAGLLNQIGSAPYGVTKHAAVGFAEWLAITYGDQGIKVSVLCPQGVHTKMTAKLPDGGVAGIDGMLGPQQVADAVVAALAEDRFLVLPHPQVETYLQRKAADYDRWLGGMRKLQAKHGSKQGD